MPLTKIRKVPSCFPFGECNLLYQDHTHELKASNTGHYIKSIC